MTEMNGNGAVSRSKTGQFLPGHAPTGGRPRGSRVRLSEAFLRDLSDEWRRSGKKVLQRVAHTAPETFLRIIATILPKALEVDNRVTLTARSELAIDVQNFVQAYEEWGRVIGVQRMPMIEAEAINEDDEQSDNGG